MTRLTTNVRNYSDNVIDVTNYPSLVATEPHRNVSDRYSFIPTTRVIDEMGRAGWRPYQVMETRAKEGNVGFQKHLIRFRNERFVIGKDDMRVGMMFPEIVVVNAHNRGASFQIMAGIFRMVCGNGMIVADSMFATHRITHTGYTDAAVRDAIMDVSDNVPRIASRVEEFRQIELDRDERMIFAESAILARFGDGATEHHVTNDIRGNRTIVLSDEAGKERAFNLEAFLQPQRHADNGTDLWRTFQIAQEKLTKGGSFEKNLNVRGSRTRKASPEGALRTKKTRESKSIDGNVNVNKVLWHMTERMAELKVGA